MTDLPPPEAPFSFDVDWPACVPDASVALRILRRELSPPAALADFDERARGTLTSVERSALASNAEGSQGLRDLAVTRYRLNAALYMRPLWPANSTDARACLRMVDELDRALKQLSELKLPEGTAESQELAAIRDELAKGAVKILNASSGNESSQPASAPRRTPREVPAAKPTSSIPDMAAVKETVAATATSVGHNLLAVLLLVGAVAIAAGGYVFWQARSHNPPTLEGIPGTFMVYDPAAQRTYVHTATGKPLSAEQLKAADERLAEKGEMLEPMGASSYLVVSKETNEQ